jgi:hypothetical protein
MERLRKRETVAIEGGLGRGMGFELLAVGGDRKRVSWVEIKQEAFFDGKLYDAKGFSGGKLGWNVKALKLARSNIFLNSPKIEERAHESF